MHPTPPSPKPLLPALFALLASAALGSAAEGPVIERVLDDRGKETHVVTPTRSFEVRGTDLYTPPADPKTKGFPGLSATLAGKPLLVLAASPTSLRLMVPADQPQRTKQILVIRVGAKRAKTKVDVGPRPQGGDPIPPEPELPFQITSFTYKSTGAGSTFVGVGVVPPEVEGMKIKLTLSYGGRQVGTRSLKAKQGRFEVTFGPYRRRAPVGFYSLDLGFSLNSQKRSKVKVLEKTLKASGKRGQSLAAYKSVQRRAFVGVGGTGPGGQILPKDRAPQEAHLRERVLASASTLEGLLGELESALALAQRIYFRAPGESSIDEARYLAWLVDKGHAKDEAEAKRLLSDTRFASRRGELDERAWAEWVKAKLIEGLRADLAEAKAFKRETLCSIDPKVEALVARAQGQLLELARSRNLFKRAKLRLPPELNSPGLSIQPLPGATPKALRATLTLLRQRVGER